MKMISRSAVYDNNGELHSWTYGYSKGTGWHFWFCMSDTTCQNTDYQSFVECCNHKGVTITASPCEFCATLHFCPIIVTSPQIWRFKTGEISFNCRAACSVMIHSTPPFSLFIMRLLQQDQSSVGQSLTRTLIELTVSIAWLTLPNRY